MDRSIHDNRMSISIDRSIGEVQPTSDGGPGWVPKSCHFIAAVLLLTGVGWPQLANATPIVVGEQQRYGSFVTTPHHTIIIIIQQDTLRSGDQNWSRCPPRSCVCCRQDKTTEHSAQRMDSLSTKMRVAHERWLCVLRVRTTSPSFRERETARGMIR